MWKRLWLRAPEVTASRKSRGWVHIRLLPGLLLLVALVALVLATMDQRTVQALPCPCTVFTGTPAPSDASDGGTIEVGMKFISEVSGYVTGARFYKTAAMNGAHTGRLWDRQGTLLATVSFSGETASGWQEASFSTPVAITAESVYTISLFAASGNYAFTGNYFGSAVNNYPLRAPAQGSADATDGLGQAGQGVFNDADNVTAYPVFTFNKTNYWVDVAFSANLGVAPTVTSTSPNDGATGVSTAPTVKAMFDSTMDSSTITTSTFTLDDAQGNSIAGTVSNNTSTNTASFAPTAPLPAGKTYTATIKGGSGTVAKNLEGIALAANRTWSFTVAAPDPCPCSLKNRANPAGALVVDDAGSVELGTKIRPTANGYITGLRFYKAITATETTHTGHVWSSTGTSLATVTFSNETAYGWQEATLSTPLAVVQDQVYTVSYGTTTAQYISLTGGLTAGMTSGYLTAPADNSVLGAASGSGNRNGVFITSAGSYPATGSTTGNYYFVDAIFATNASDVAPLQVSLTQPRASAYGVTGGVKVSARFNRPIDAATVTNATVRLFDSGNNQVAGTAGYDTTTGDAYITPSGNLAYGQTYTAKLSATIADHDGQTLGSEYTWSFTVGSELSTNPTQGSGGRILVVTTVANKYSQYYAEILRTEGLNYFDVQDLSTVSASTLANYDAVVLSEASLTQSQADMLSAWVSSGGNLVAMRPDKKLAGLLGLTDASSTRSNQYLLVDTSAAPGTGIVGETIQFKGVADNYTASGATTVATLYSNANTSTANPATTTRQVGANGGTAVAFTYDLAKSVVALHQGNQAWAGQDRDGDGGAVRPSDMFFGAKTGDVQPDWVDLNKIHIPQADEQQRLLANSITEATKDLRPLPRFWYLPGDTKAALVLAGDDHALSNEDGTEATVSKLLNESSTYCSMVDWECVRANHYTYRLSSLTNNRALQYQNLGFGIGDHVNTSCSNFANYTDLGNTFTTSLNDWRSKFSSLPHQLSSRIHCYMWSDWDSVPRVEHDNGIRYDLGYLAFPAGWVGSRTPLITGSGMNMRFTDADGDLLDVYQGVTNLENTISNATVVGNVLDNATGSAGYYGMFGTHYDMSDSYHLTLLNAAQTRGVPLISPDQALAWLDGHGSSTFSNFDGDDGQFTFDVKVAVGAYDLSAMLPTHDATGTLDSLLRGGTAVGYQTKVVKGVQYAVFNAIPGSYTATYSDVGQKAANAASPGSSTASTPRKPSTTAAAYEPAAETTTDQPTADTTSTEEDNVTPKNADTPQKDSTSLAAWKWVTGILLALFAAWLLAFILLKRRKRLAH